MSESRLNPYLQFNGNAKEAMEFYKEALGGELTLTTFGEGMPSEGVADDKIMHAELKNGALSFMGSDTLQGGKYTVGTNFSMSISGDNEEELRGFWDKLSEGGTVTMPFEKAPWGDIFGMFTDKFGIDWMINVTAPKA